MNLKSFFSAVLLAAGTLSLSATAPASAAAKGTLTSPDSIRSQVLEQLEDADICTKQWMDTQARIHFSVNELGEIEVIDVETADANLKNCIMRKLNTAQLAIPRQGQVQSYSIKVNFRVV